MKKLTLIQELVALVGYEVELRGEDVILSRGTPENGETIMLNNFADATNGSASHYRNGNENIVRWRVDGNNLKFIYRD